MQRNAHPCSRKAGPCPTGPTFGWIGLAVPWRALAFAGIAGIGLPLLLACSEPPRGNLKYIEQDRFDIANPSKDRALATGIGCGFTLKDAETRAQEVSSYNLRRLTGSARYAIEFTRLREVPDPHQACIELQARAIPTRLR